MPYSRPWTTVVPDSSDPAAFAASELRNLKLDIEERMQTLLGPDWAKGEFSEATHRLVLHWSHANFAWADATIAGGRSRTMLTTPADEWRYVFWWLPLPVGAKIVKVRLVNSVVNGTLQLVSANEEFRDVLASSSTMFLDDLDVVVERDVTYAVLLLTRQYLAVVHAVEVTYKAHVGVFL